MLSAVISSTHSYSAMRLAPQQIHQRCVRPGPLVLRATLLNTPTPTVDRDQTVSRRFEPNSRTTLIGEQPNPWDLLQPQDVMSRHRGAKPHRRYGRLDAISLLSLEYLLSVCDGPSMRNHRITMAWFPTCSRCPSCSQPGFCHYTRQTVSNRPEPNFARLRYSLGGDRPSQTAHHTGSLHRFGARLELKKCQGSISKMAPPELTPRLHRLLPILHKHFLSPL
jgi:hypothetical protein